MNVVLELLARERALAHAIGHYPVSGLWFEGMLGMQYKAITQIKCPAHLVVIKLPSQLHIAAAVVLVGVRGPVIIRDGYRLTIRAALAFPEFFDWLPAVSAFVLDRSEHVRGPPHVVYVGILLQKPQQSF